MPTSLPLRRQAAARHGRTFYSVVFVISLFACYSIVRSFADLKQTHSLGARSLYVQDQEASTRHPMRLQLLTSRQCRLVHSAKDKCAFVRANCPDEEAGLISYLQFYYCDLQHVKPLAFTIIVVWMGLLFSTIGIAASDFLCINLSTIAAILGMSESLTGVTFLAFGNGSPDVFSTFAAMSSHSGSLAVGELIGAAGFITAVVAGSMAITKPFQVARRSFIRDVSFFAVAASFSLVFLADGSLHLWECVTMIGFYVFYVVFVVLWHWWLSGSRKRKLAETTARLHHHIPGQQELEVPYTDDDEETRPASERSALLRTASGESIPTLMGAGTPAWKLQEDEDDETRDRYLAELQSNMRLRPSHARRNTMTPIRPSLIGALEFRSILSSLERKSTGTNLNMRRFSEDATHLLDGAETTAQSQPVPHSDFLTPDSAHLLPSQSGRNRAVSANDAHSLKIDTDLLGPIQPEVAVSTASTTPTEGRHKRPSGAFLQSLNEPGRPPSPKFLLSPAGIDETSDPMEVARPRSPSLLGPQDQSFHTPEYDEERHQSSRSPMLSAQHMPPLKIPTLNIPHSEDMHRRSPLSHQVPYMDSPRSTPRHSRASSIRLPAPSLSPDLNPDIITASDGDSEELKIYSWWPYQYLPAPQVIISTLYPTLYGWSEKSIIDKMLGLVTAPSVFLLTITLPVVDEGNDEDGSPTTVQSSHMPSRQSTGGSRRLAPDTPNMMPQYANNEAPSHPHSASRQNTMPVKNPMAATDELETDVSGPKDWNRWLVFVQIFTAPIFVVAIVWANVDEDHSIKLLLRMLLGSTVFSLIILAILLVMTRPDREPKYRSLFCFLGFAVAIAWISTIANEVVGVLKAFGVILGMSDAILGLTIFAVGNSCGDLVADITVAKLGYPVMALSACFGGPMLNILLGIGISGMYMTIRGADRRHSKHPNKPLKYRPYTIEVSTTLIISGVSLLVTLVGLLIVVPLNGWKMDRKIGIGLITLWTLSTIGNVVVEVLGYGGELGI